MLTAEDLDNLQEDTIIPHAALKQFIKSFGASLDPRLWVKLNEEELKELYAEKPGTAAHLKEYCDLIYVFIGLELTTYDGLGALTPDDEIKNISKLMGRVERALQEGLERYGEHTTAVAFTRVHNSNMSKLDENGKPIKREDGKVMKGPNYKAPDLTDLLEK